MQETNPYAAPGSHIETPRIPPSDYPWWVKGTIYGGTSRSALRILAAVCVAISIGCAFFWSKSDRYFWASAGGLVAAAFYWMTFRWIERNGSWSDLK